jgi:hypothetical protein
MREHPAYTLLRNIFFSEKKKPKTFGLWELPGHGLDRGSGAKNKSLLVLFFRKERS